MKIFEVFPLLGCLLLFFDTGVCQKEELIAAVVLFRHGDRSISESFPTDPYKNITYWPEGYGQLLNKGKARSYQLGKWLRKRYERLLSKNYKQKELYVLSSGEDRCLMSAQCVTAGMFEPVEESRDFLGILSSWGPVPIHSRPKYEDPVVAMLAPCATWSKEYENLKKSNFFTALLEKHSDLCKYISNRTGWVMDDLEDFRNLYKVLHIYREHNESFIPSWINSLDEADKEALDYLAGISFAMETYTTQLKRLSAGPFLHKLLQYLDTFVGSNDHFKLVMFSGHDTTITAVLNTMEGFNLVPPEFSSSVLWEVYQRDSETLFVRMMYRKTTESDELQMLKLKNCSFNCDYRTFKQFLLRYAPNEESWKNECQSSQ